MSPLLECSKSVADLGLNLALKNLQPTYQLRESWRKWTLLSTCGLLALLFNAYAKDFFEHC